MPWVLFKDFTDSSLEKVNDVKLEQSLVGRLLDYGDLEILTASELGVNRFTYVGQPIHLKTAMLNAKEKLEHGQAGLEHRSEVDVAGPIEQVGLFQEFEVSRGTYHAINHIYHLTAF